MTAVLHDAAHVRRSDPRALNPVQLVEYTRFIAAEVQTGQYPFVDYNAESRWHRRIYRDQRVDVWLISWLPSQGTQLHDHGGSSGSFTVITGELSEAVYQHTGRGAGGLRERSHPAGRSVGFDSRYVHDVRNTSDRPAISVHAYSRPLTSMTYYDLDDGTLVPLVTVPTDDPEPEFVPETS